MKEWAKKNLSALISIVATLIFVVALIVIIAGSGYGAFIKGGDGSPLLFVDIQNMKDSMSSAYGLAVAGIIIGFVSVVPVAIRLIFAILNIDFLARILRLCTAVLAWISIILLIVLNVKLLQNDAFDVSIWSIVVFYILLFVGACVITGSTVKK